MSPPSARGVNMRFFEDELGADIERKRRRNDDDNAKSAAATRFRPILRRFRSAGSVIGG